MLDLTLPYSLISYCLSCTINCAIHTSHFPDIQAHDLLCKRIYVSHHIPSPLAWSCVFCVYYFTYVLLSSFVKGLQNCVIIIKCAGQNNDVLYSSNYMAVLFGISNVIT